jgi:Uma2 family endonuclease
MAKIEQLVDSLAGRLLTAEEYGELPDLGGPSELVRGQIMMMNMPASFHGKICFRIAYLLQRYLDDHDLGHVLTNDSGVITGRDPDTVRGADVAYYSYARVPRDYPRKGYWPAAPELVFEVLSPSDQESETLVKKDEYLQAGVLLVCIVAPERQCVTVFSTDHPAVVLTAKETLEFPSVLPGFKVQVGQLFA